MTTILGIDHGYGMMKTTNTQMLTGVVTYDAEPHSLTNTLQWRGKYYVCGTSRQPLTPDKTSNENYFVLTLAAICRELQFRKEPCIRQEIKLAVGLPLTRIGHEREGFIDYLMSFGETFDVRFEDKRYAFSIKDVIVFPQGYAAYVSQANCFKDQPSVILADCGSWTIDVMRIDNGLPNAATCASLDFGAIRLMNFITEQVRRKHGSSISEPQIEQVLRLEESLLDDSIQTIIMECAEKYASEIIAGMNENGLDIQNIPVVWMGGGAAIMKHFAKTLKHTVYIEDVRANARGFEQIAKAVARNVQAAV